MALQQNFESPTGLSLKNAYHNIKSISWNKSTNIITIEVGVYIDGQARLDGKQVESIRKYNFNGNSSANILKLVYQFLKSNNDYSEAVDV